MINIQTSIGGIPILLPDIGGLLNGGVLSVIAYFISLLFSVMFVVWVAYSIYAGIKIITSYASPEGIQQGFTIIKNIWIGIAMFLGFLVILSVIGSFTGVGDIYSWSSNLAQCGGGADSEFKFRYVEIELKSVRSLPEGEYGVGCCSLGGGDQRWEHIHASDVGLNEYFAWEDRCQNISFETVQ